MYVTLSNFKTKLFFFSIFQKKMEASELISPEKVVFSDSPQNSYNKSQSSTLSAEWSEQTNRRSLYHRSRSVADVCKDDYSTAEIRRIRERLVRQHAPQPSQLKHFTRKQKLTLISLALVDFMSFCSMSIMAPFFPKEAGLKGMNEITMGFVFSFYAFVIFVSSPIFGKIVSKIFADHSLPLLEHPVFFSPYFNKNFTGE